MADRGMSIFLDVFRRANKKDDDAISWEEFLTFFSDGVMGKEELAALFADIDTHNTNNIDTGELCAYFSKHLGAFKEIYGLMEELNTKITNVLFSTSQSYKDSSRTDQFVTRFLIREVLNQITALERPVESANDALDEQSREERSDVIPVVAEQTVKKTGQIIPGRIVRRARRQVSSQMNSSSDGTAVNIALTSQVDKLSALLDRLEHKMNFDGYTDEEVNADHNEKTLLLQNDMVVKDDMMDNFRDSIRDYVEFTNNAPGCLSISVQHYKDSGKFTVYEVWNKEDQQSNYSQSDGYKDFIQKCETHLIGPQENRSVLFPAYWWIKDY